MASQSGSYSRLLIKDLFVRRADNANITANHILIANGRGGTYWNSVSTIFPVSSFKTVVGGNNLASTFSADVNYNVLLVSTTAIPSTFGSYVDPRTSSLMLSLQFPPIVVSGGSMSGITDTFAVPNSNALSPVSLQSTVKFYGARDIIFSTVNTQQAVYVGISSFSAPGYSTIYGEMQNNAKLSVSSFSTVFCSPQNLSFVSSIPFTLSDGNTMSTNAAAPINGSTLFMSSIQFDAGHIARYINMSNLNTKISIEYYPNYVFSHMENDSDTIQPMSSIKKVTSYIQADSRYNETTNVRYMTSQQISTPTYIRTLSNVFTEAIRMDISSYQLSTSIANNPTVKLAMYHQIDNAYNNTGNVAISSLSYLNNTLSTNGLYLHVYNQPTIPAAQVPATLYPGIL
jgi:hypothetical protein